MTKYSYSRLFTKQTKVGCVVIAVSLLLCACSSTPIAAPTAYKAATKDGYGYKSERLNANLYNVLFKATDKTPADSIQQYALYHAAEIASNNDFTFLAVENTDVKRKAVLAREVVVSNGNPPLFKTERQCTMSGCEEVAQPMGDRTNNDIIKTQIHDIYLTITVKMAKDKTTLGKNALSVADILSQPLSPKRTN